MKVLILYASEEGHTGRIARFIEDEVKAVGHEVEITDTKLVAKTGGKRTIQRKE